MASPKGGNAKTTSLAPAAKGAPTARPPLSDLSALPWTCHTEDGAPGDPINLVFIGSRSQLEQAFSGMGWEESAHLTLGSVLKMMWKFLTRASYPNAPVSSLYIGDGDRHKEDLAFERENGSTVKQRDHVRFWDSGQKSLDGQIVWIGAASHDIGVEWNHEDRLSGPTHRIDSDVDAERDRLAAGLRAADVEDLGLWRRSAFSAVNGGGDRYSTDGGVAIFRAPIALEPLPLLKTFVSCVQNGFEFLGFEH